MAFAAAVIIVPVSLLFFISGLVINLIQAVSFVLIWPLSKNTYRKINRIVLELLLLEIICLVDWWAGVKRSGCLGSSLAVMKKSLKYLPVIGWSTWFSEYLFLERKWAKDENTIKTGLKRLVNFPRPFWLALFVEGTRFTEAKLIAAQKYAASQGLPIPRNVLVPCTKGFVTAVSHLRSFVPAIYDITVAIPKTSPSPTVLGLFNCQSSVVHIHMKRRLMKQLPETDEGIAQWCIDLFVEKDKLLDRHIAEDTFSDQPLQDIGRPIKSLLVMMFWACSVIYGIRKFLLWSSLLSSWKGIAFSAFALAIVTILMQILIFFTQSERSTSARVASRKLSENDRRSSDSLQKPLLV